MEKLAADQHGDITIMSWNINSVASSLPNIKLRHGNLASFFATYKANIVCLQEAKVPRAKLTKELACVDGFESFWSISREKQGYSGATTYAATHMSPTAANVDCLGDGQEDIDREGRMVMTDHGSGFVLINVYVPNAPMVNRVDGSGKERPRLAYKLRFLNALLEKMDRLVASGKQVICCGDFNVSVEPIDVHAVIGHDSHHEEEHALMRKMIARFPDAWRVLHPGEEGAYTCWDEKTSGRAFNVGARIDYFLVSPGLMDRVVGCDIILDIPHKWSDHAAVVLRLRDIPPVPPHPPCALSSLCNKAFNDRAQGSIARMFAAGTKRAHSQTLLSDIAPQEDTPTATSHQADLTNPLEPGQKPSPTHQQQERMPQPLLNTNESALSIPPATKSTGVAPTASVSTIACQSKLDFPVDASNKKQHQEHHESPPQQTSHIPATGMLVTDPHPVQMSSEAVDSQPHLPAPSQEPTLPLPHSPICEGSSNPNTGMAARKDSAAQAEDDSTNHVHRGSSHVQDGVGGTKPSRQTSGSQHLVVDKSAVKKPANTGGKGPRGKQDIVQNGQQRSISAFFPVKPKGTGSNG